MRRWKIIATVGSIGLIGLSFLPAGSVDPTVQSAVETITAHELESIVEFLASDEMQGRATDSLSNQIAASYLANQFELEGLEPAGDSGTYFQRFSLVKGKLGEKNHFGLQKLGSWQNAVGDLRQDYLPSPLTAVGAASGEILFAGYGISYPDTGYDDYSGVDASGKVVAVLPGMPPPAEGATTDEDELSTEFGTPLYKIVNAQQHGAVALLFLPREGQQLSPSVKNLWPSGEKNRRYQLSERLSRVRIPALYISAEFLSPFLERAEDLEELKRGIDESRTPASRLIPLARASLEVDVVREEIEVRNVLARIAGSDPDLSSEAVLVGAHFDHVGVNGESIFNGADDDASGTSAVLEIAEAFVESPVKPRRSVLFALWNAEEQGLLGSSYYTDVPAVPLAETIAVFQLDMIGRNQEVDNPDSWRFGGLPVQTSEENENTLHVIGYSRSQEMKALVVRENRDLALDLKFDLDNHKLNLIRRSDHWPFLLKGIPAIFFTTGLHPDYHTPEDTEEKINYPKMERVARLAFLCLWEAANTSVPPRLD